MSSGSTVIVASAMLITSAHRSPELNTPYSQPSGQPSKISPARKNMGFELPHVNRPGRTRWNQRLVWLFELASAVRSEEHTSELQSLMRISYAVFCLKKKKTK